MLVHALGASELLARLRARELGAVEVVEALAARRRDVDPRVNAFVHVREEALTEAHAVDEARARGAELGPLAGLPITVKDNVDVAGLDSTLGMRARRGKPATADAVLVAELRRRGAIVLGKTNVPQLLLAQETENSVFGLTKNPWNLDRAAGGSSGGEAAAVASGTSPLGIGTDIGGSIRIPAHFCGTVGFKPTLDRWSNRGSNTAIAGQEIVRSQIGCLARNVADCALLWRTLDPRAQSLEDPRVVPLAAADPDGVDVRGLAVGIVEGDDFLAPTASLRRAVARARAVLEAAGARTVVHVPVATEEVVFVWLAALAADGGRTLDQLLEGEPISAQLRPSRTILRVPMPLRRTLGRIAHGLGERRLARLLGELGERRVDELWALTKRRTDLRLEEHDRWRRAGLDAVVCPPHVVPSLGHRQSGDFVMSCGAAFRWTLIDFPAGVVPVTRVRDDEIGKHEARDRVEKKVASIDRKSVGLPVGVQVVARPHHEETLLAVMAAIERGVRGDAGFPATPVDPA
jgi:fatty acid amide hydrolase